MIERYRGPLLESAIDLEHPLWHLVSKRFVLQWLSLSWAEWLVAEMIVSWPWSPRCST